MTNETKAWYASKTLWGTFGTLISGLLIMIRPEASAEATQIQTFLSNNVPEILEQIMFFVSLLITVWGRLSAKKQVTATGR